MAKLAILSRTNLNARALAATVVPTSTAKLLASASLRAPVTTTVRPGAVSLSRRPVALPSIERSSFADTRPDLPFAERMIAGAPAPVVAAWGATCAALLGYAGWLRYGR